MEDFFGTKRTITSDQMISGQNIVISSDGDRFAFGRQFQFQFQLPVTMQSELGTTAVYWKEGIASGNLSISQAVGPQGFFQGIKNTPCGKLRTITVSTGGEGQCTVAIGGGLTFSGAKLTTISGQGQFGTEDVMQSVAYVFASLSR